MSISGIHRRTLVTAFSLAWAMMAAGCGGSRTATPAKPGTSAVPRVPAPTRGGAVAEPEPESKPAVSAPTSHPIGPWLEWQVAQSPMVTGKAYLKLIAAPESEGARSILELSSYESSAHEEFPSLYLRAPTPAGSL